MCVRLKPADGPFMFRSEQHVLTLAVDSLSFHYTTAHPGLSHPKCACMRACVCYCRGITISHMYTHAHAHVVTDMFCCGRR